MFSVYKNFLVVSAKTKLVFVNSDNPEKFWIHDIDFNGKPIAGKPKKFLNYDENENEENTENVTEKQIDLFVVSEKLNLLALTTNDKLIHFFEIGDNTLKLLSIRRFYRNPTQLVFCDESKQLFFVDKGGDCFAYSTEKSDDPGRWIFGHMSQVLSLILSPDNKFLLTCDRDEKIRVSDISDMPEIFSICLGHKEFVSCLIFLSSANEKFLVSLSGDKTLRVWDFKKGIQTQLIELDYVGMCICSVETDSSNYIAIRNEKNCVFVYKYNFNSDNELELKLLATKEYSGTVEIVSHAQKFLILSSNIVERVTFTDDSCTFDPVCNLKETTNLEISRREQDISYLFKKKFENQEEYLERKRKRLEEN